MAEPDDPTQAPPPSPSYLCPLPPISNILPLLSTNLFLSFPPPPLTSLKPVPFWAYFVALPGVKNTEECKKQLLHMRSRKKNLKHEHRKSEKG